MYVEMCVCASISLRSFMSNIRPKCLRKSAPRSGFLTSAMMNIQGSWPRLSVRDFFPIGVFGGVVGRLI